MIKSMTIEFHHAANQWFVSRSIDHTYFDPDVEADEADEITREELCGPWGANCSNTEIDNYLFGAVVYKLGPSTITVRGVSFRAVGYNAVFCGYDLTRIHLEAIEPVVFDSYESWFVPTKSGEKAS